MVYRAPEIDHSVVWPIYWSESRGKWCYDYMREYWW
jgi:hypothetical protein